MLPVIQSGDIKSLFICIKSYIEYCLVQEINLLPRYTITGIIHGEIIPDLINKNFNNADMHFLASFPYVLLYTILHILKDYCKFQHE